MIAATSPTSQLLHWQQALTDAITNPAELCAVLGLDPALLSSAFAAAGQFPLRVPRGYVARMRRGDPHDPLLLQVLPAAAELARVLPYYLHLLDEVQGAAHFDVAERRALGLYRELAARLPGYLVPRLVREVAGAPAKTAVGP